MSPHLYRDHSPSLFLSSATTHFFFRLSPHRQASDHLSPTNLHPTIQPSYLASTPGVRLYHLPSFYVNGWGRSVRRNRSLRAGAFPAVPGPPVPEHPTVYSTYHKNSDQRHPSQCPIPPRFSDGLVMPPIPSSMPSLAPSVASLPVSLHVPSMLSKRSCRHRVDIRPRMGDGIAMRDTRSCTMA